MHAHILCIDTSYGALFRFVEIFSDYEQKTLAPGENFIVSWISPVAFIEASGEYTYLRRPVCSTKKNFCNQFDAIVDSCDTMPLHPKNGYVKSDERVYFIPPDIKVKSCFINNRCCSYVSTLKEGLCGGNVTDCPSDYCFDRFINTTNGLCDQVPSQANLNCATDFCFNRSCNVNASTW